MPATEQILTEDQTFACVNLGQCEVAEFANNEQLVSMSTYRHVKSICPKLAKIAGDGMGVSIDCGFRLYLGMEGMEE